MGCSTSTLTDTVDTNSMISRGVTPQKDLPARKLYQLNEVHEPSPSNTASPEPEVDRSNNFPLLDNIVQTANSHVPTQKPSSRSPSITSVKSNKSDVKKTPSRSPASQSSSLRSFATMSTKALSVKSISTENSTPKSARSGSAKSKHSTRSNSARSSKNTIDKIQLSPSDGKETKIPNFSDQLSPTGTFTLSDGSKTSLLNSPASTKSPQTDSQPAQESPNPPVISPEPTLLAIKQKSVEGEGTEIVFPDTGKERNQTEIVFQDDKTEDTNKENKNATQNDKENEINEENMFALSPEKDTGLNDSTLDGKFHPKLVETDATGGKYTLKEASEEGTNTEPETNLCNLNDLLPNSFENKETFSNSPPLPSTENTENPLDFYLQDQHTSGKIPVKELFSDSESVEDMPCSLAASSSGLILPRPVTSKKKEKSLCSNSSTSSINSIYSFPTGLSKDIHNVESSIENTTQSGAQDMSLVKSEVQVGSETVNVDGHGGEHNLVPSDLHDSILPSDLPSKDGYQSKDGNPSKDGNTLEDLNRKETEEKKDTFEEFESLDISQTNNGDSNNSGSEEPSGTHETDLKEINPTKLEDELQSGDGSASQMIDVRDSPEGDNEKSILKNENSKVNVKVIRFNLPDLKEENEFKKSNQSISINESENCVNSQDNKDGSTSDFNLIAESNLTDAEKDIGKDVITPQNTMNSENDEFNKHITEVYIGENKTDSDMKTTDLVVAQVIASMDSENKDINNECSPLLELQDKVDVNINNTEINQKETIYSEKVFSTDSEEYLKTLSPDKCSTEKFPSTQEDERSKEVILDENIDRKQMASSEIEENTPKSDETSNEIIPKENIYSEKITDAKPNENFTNSKEIFDEIIPKENIYSEKIADTKAEETIENSKEILHEIIPKENIYSEKIIDAKPEENIANSKKIFDEIIPKETIYSEKITDTKPEENITNSKEIFDEIIPKENIYSEKITDIEPEENITNSNKASEEIIPKENIDIEKVVLKTDPVTVEPSSQNIAGDNNVDPEFKDASTAEGSKTITTPEIGNSEGGTNEPQIENNKERNSAAENENIILNNEAENNANLDISELNDKPLEKEECEAGQSDLSSAVSLGISLEGDNLKVTTTARDDDHEVKVTEKDDAKIPEVNNTLKPLVSEKDELSKEDKQKNQDNENEISELNPKENQSEIITNHSPVTKPKENTSAENPESKIKERERKKNEVNSKQSENVSIKLAEISSLNGFVGKLVASADRRSSSRTSDTSERHSEGSKQVIFGF